MDREMRGRGGGEEGERGGREGTCEQVQQQP